MPYDPDPEALFRYTLVSDVRARMARGIPRAEAVGAISALEHVTFDGRTRSVSRRTLYRWLAAFAKHGFDGLRPAGRPRIATSTVLPSELVDFLRTQKEKEPATSIPEILRRAEARGIVDSIAGIDRTTAYRAARRMGLPVRHRRPQPPDGDQRRFAYPHRMQMVLADGNHFRAGARRRRRVALFVLDDATRFGLFVRVGTSETTKLFLESLYQLVRRHGLMDALYLDRGPGFISLDTHDVIKNLERTFIHGARRYPAGHGKIEKFNRRANVELRALDLRPDVDPDPAALTLRLRHYLDEVYNHTPHESLGGETPFQRFERDPRTLVFPSSEADLRGRFVTTFTRRVSADHCVPIGGTAYEVPRGHGRQRILIHHRLLEGTYAVVDEGRLVTIHPVDLARNARDRRGRPPPPRPVTPPEPTAAQTRFDRAHRPVLDPDGGVLPTREETD